MELKDEVALITGSAKGVGSEIAIALARKGVTVIVTYLNSKKEAEKTLTTIKKYSGKSLTLQLDVTNKESVKSAVKEIMTRFGRIDILVNNVGDFIFKPLTETTTAEFEHVIENNLLSVFFCCKEVLPHMRKKKYGRIINIGCASCDRLVIRERTTPYYIAKTGVLILSKALAVEEAKHSIRVNVISPGVLETSLVKQGGPTIKKNEIAEAILFLVSDRAEKINGANLEVTGGWVPGFK